MPQIQLKSRIHQNIVYIYTHRLDTVPGMKLFWQNAQYWIEGTNNNIQPTKDYNCY